MFERRNASSEVEAEFERLLIKNASEEETKVLDDVEQAIDLINQAARIFDRCGLIKEAEDATALIEVFAKKKVKKKPVKKNKEVSKKNDLATKGLNSKKEVENLKNVGWMFNKPNDTNDADDVSLASFRPKEKTAEDWQVRAEYWMNQGRKFEESGHRLQADHCFKKADECLAKADKLEMDNEDTNDMKLGISSGFHDVSDSAGYWRICAKDKMENGDLLGAEKCLHKAIEAGKKEEAAEKFDMEDLNMVLDKFSGDDDAEFWKEEAKKCGEKAAKAQMAGKHQLAKKFHQEAEACLDKVDELKKMKKMDVDTDLEELMGEYADKDTMHADDFMYAKDDGTPWDNAMWSKNENEMDLAKGLGDLDEFEDELGWDNERRKHKRDEFDWEDG